MPRRRGNYSAGRWPPMTPPRCGRARNGCPEPTRYPQLPSTWIVRDDQTSQICLPDELHCHTEPDAPDGGYRRFSPFRGERARRRASRSSAGHLGRARAYGSSMWSPSPASCGRGGANFTGRMLGESPERGLLLGAGLGASAAERPGSWRPSQWRWYGGGVLPGRLGARRNGGRWCADRWLAHLVPPLVADV
jgi:hypothetical protein